MKKASLSVMLFFVCAWTIAQEVDEEKYNSQPEVYSEKGTDIKTLFGNSTSHGGYGAFSIRYNELSEMDGVVLGGRGGWVIGHSFTLGLAGYGFFTESKKSKIIPNDYEYNIGGGYGGLLLEPVIGYRFPIHLSFPILIGAGGIAYSRDYVDNGWEEWDETYDYTEDSDAFFIIEPGAELELNLVKFMRVCFGAYYRYTSDIKLETKDGNNSPLVKKDVLQNLSFGVTFKFGKF